MVRQGVSLYMGLEAGANAENTVRAKTRDLQAFLLRFPLGLRTPRPKNMRGPSLDLVPTSTGSHVSDADFKRVCLHSTAFNTNRLPSRSQGHVTAPKTARVFLQVCNLG